MDRLSTFRTLSLLALLMGISAITARAQITPAADAYTNTASPSTNYGAQKLLDVDSPSQTTYIQFDLSSIPAGYSGSSVAKATLKLYVNAVTGAGSFNVDYVNGSWSENTITANMAPALGTTIVPNVALDKTQVKDYLLIDITPAVQGWLNGTQTNDGIALVANSPLNASLDSKESTTQSHPPELDIVFASGSGGITGVLTAAGSGLTGGGTSGTLNLSLLTSCGNGQILAWNGSGWGCSNAGTGTITGVAAGTDLTGGGSGGNVTVSLDTTRVPQLASNNVFSGSQTISGNAGIGAAASNNSYTPLTVGTTNSFGTWLAIANSSSGGHTWNIISAGSGNAEGAGNLGITDLTGKSTIWLEGNTNTTNLVASGSAGGVVIDADVSGTNNGTSTPGLRFGGSASGEGIASNRLSGNDRYGLNFFTNYTSRMTIFNDGEVGIGTSPGAQFGVLASSNAYPATYTAGYFAPSGSGQNGSDGMHLYGGWGDQSTPGTYGGVGLLVYGGSAGSYPGDGIVTYAGGYGTAGIYAQGSVKGYAGYFNGDVSISGILSKAGGSFKIDHPLDPANKYLSHSFVESPDMMNIYNGIATLDSSGEATITMPDWFSALNRDFRYQLTAVGAPGPNLYIAEELANNQFKVAGGQPGMKVSWQITGIRQDAWANAHRIPVEEEKDDRERGFYLHPDLYGAPEEKQIEWARHPEMMRRTKELREKSERKAETRASTARAAAVSK